jgi:hypothetical protein
MLWWSLTINRADVYVSFQLHLTFMGILSGLLLLGTVQKRVFALVEVIELSLCRCSSSKGILAIGVVFMMLTSVLSWQWNLSQPSLVAESHPVFIPIFLRAKTSWMVPSSGLTSGSDGEILTPTRLSAIY